MLGGGDGWIEERTWKKDPRNFSIDLWSSNGPSLRYSPPLITIHRPSLERGDSNTPDIVRTPRRHPIIFLSLSLSLYLAVLVRLLRNSLSTKGDGSGGAEAPPIPRHTGEKCRMYARRALSFSSRALAQLFRAFLLGARAAIGENPLLLGRGAPPAMKIRAAHSLCPPLYFCRAIYIGSSFVRVSRLWISRLPISRPPRADREFDFAPL